MTEGKWIKPKDGFNSGLKIYNSITGNTEEFIPKNGNNVGWYICGPTVYDSSHLGHARNYVIFDILRRIVSDYFGYNVFFVMNITDIDDKIIIRAHYRRLSAVVSAIEQLLTLNSGYKDLLDSNDEFKQAFTKGKELVENESKEIAKLQRVHTQLSSLARSLFPKPNLVDEERLFKEFEEFSIQKGYLELAKIYEKEFLEDMERLGVKPADALTRVSEYVPEIIDYITKIIENDFAYEASGNVYFDIQKFKGAGFEYGKTSNIDSNDKQSELLAEGEGLLAAAEGKRNPNDFALWKRSKEGEPEWESPWGLGRPGWHIECSAMCSDLLGSNVDINCGGVDLKFPHHDNQLAQSEAHFGCKQWVNYFLHSGHLHIAKLKMSKSLKNFITIRECLRHYHPRQVRFFFLMHNFSDNLDIDMVGGGPPKLGGQTGILKILSAKLNSTDVSSHLQNLVFDHNSIKLEKGANLKEIFNLGEEQKEEKGMLVIEYLCDGIKRTSGWDVNGSTLEEEVYIKAGGKIMQFEEVVNIDKIFVDFFLNIRALMRELPNISDVPQKWNKADRALYDELQSSKSRVHNALCDSFNTPLVINVLMNLVNQTYNYIKDFSSSFKLPILVEIVNYVTKIFKVFGLIYDDDFGYQWSESKKEKVEEEVGEILNAFTSFRDSVRSYARAKKSKEFIEEFCSSTLIPSSSPHPSKPIFDLFTRFVESVKNNAENTQKVLQICDELRDDLILQLGVRFEDDHFMKGKSVWKLDELSSTLAERKKKKEELISRLHNQAEREAKKRAEEEKKRAAEEIDRIPPELYFQKSPDHIGKYSSFDVNGLPTHDAEGKEISKGLRKKLETLHKKHVTKHKQQLEKDKQLMK